MLDSEIEWDTRIQMLSGWVAWNGARIQVRIPRDLIHTIPFYNDAIESEIERFKDDILERLKPVILPR